MSRTKLHRKSAAPAGHGLRHRVAALAVLGAVVLAPLSSAPIAQELKIPNLGEGSSSLFSAEYEHQLGRAWLRVFRSQVATVNDPLLFSYLEDLIFELVTHSELQDRRIELVLVDNP
ncbi:MAG: hypothetical protein AAGA95_02155, partial [Pseudomonadota bacterium]